MENKIKQKNNQTDLLLIGIKKELIELRGKLEKKLKKTRKK